MIFNLKLSEDEAQKVLDSLAKEPYIDVVNLIENIQSQAIEQRQEQSEKELQ